MKPGGGFGLDRNSVGIEVLKVGVDGVNELRLVVIEFGEELGERLTELSL